MNRLFFVSVLFLCFQQGFGANYYTAQDGSMTDAATWQEGNIPRIPNFSDTSNHVYISHSVTNPTNGQSVFKCYVEVTMSGSLYSNQQFHINGPKAHIVVWGYMNVHNNLYMENGGLLEVFYGGYVFVDNKVDNSVGGTINLHGGTICWHNLWKGSAPTGVGVMLHQSCYGSTGPLGITLLSFETEYSMGMTKITWVTENESDNAFFRIERSKDLVDWELVQSTAGSLYSSGILEYEVLDKNPSYGINYYRLSQIDVDGTITIFDGNWLRYIYCDRDDRNSIFPNPAGPEISFMNLVMDNALFSIIDMTGMIVYTGHLTNGENIIPLAGLSSGVFNLKTEWGESFRFIKQ